jgi:hypothetical protein
MSLKLTQLAAKPQLIEITVDKPEIVEKYGDSIAFWIYDRQPIEKFIQMATLAQDNYGEMVKMVNNLILDESGNPAIGEGETLPNDIMMVVINAVIERLGK